MEQKEKPRICEILGVEVNQWFQIDYPHRDYFWLAVKEDGKIWEVGELHIRWEQMHCII